MRRQRAAVGAAGIYVELIVATLATFVWWGTDAASPLHQLSLALVVVCTAHTLVLNANPLMRFDGYYLLSDLLGVPNLSAQAGEAMTAYMCRCLGIQPPFEPVAGPWLRRFLLTYCTTSYVYRFVVLASTLWLAFQWLEPRKLGVLCVPLVVAALFTNLGLPLYRFGRTLHQHGSLRQVKPLRVCVGLGVLMLAALVVFVVPFPVHVEGAALIQVDPSLCERVTAPDCGGFLERLLVEDGQEVRGGEPLAILANPQLEVALRLNEADQSLRLDQRRARIAHLAEGGPTESDSGLNQVEFELRALQREHEVLSRQRAALTLRAPRDGVVMELVARDRVGSWLARGGDLCRVADPGALRAILLVDPSDRPLVAEGGRARVRAHGSGTRSSEGTVREIANAEAGQIPPALSRTGGGEIATRQDPVSRQERPTGQLYLVAIELDQSDATLHPGVLGRAKIDAGSHTLAWRAKRYLSVTFHWGL